MNPDPLHFVVAMLKNCRVPRFVKHCSHVLCAAVASAWCHDLALCAGLRGVQLVLVLGHTRPLPQVHQLLHDTTVTPGCGNDVPAISKQATNVIISDKPHNAAYTFSVAEPSGAGTFWSEPEPV